jgi:D-lactate dehydrogenase
MREIKDIFDPSHILNPGVILNDDPRVHVANLKHITPVPPHSPSHLLPLPSVA